MDRILTSERLRVLIGSVSCGMILANLAICSSPSLGRFAPLYLTSTWLYAVAILCGLALAMALDEAGAILVGVFSMALIAVLVFSSVLILAAILNSTPLLDVVFLSAFQQSFVRFIVICIMGSVGAFCAILLKLSFGGL